MNMFGGISNMMNNASNQMSQMNVASSMSSIGAALQSTRMSAMMQNYSNQGMLASMGLELNSTRNNMMMDIAAMGQRTAMSLLSKQVDQFAYNEMIREKITNLFMDMEKQRTENAFQRAKSAVQSMKY